MSLMASEAAQDTCAYVHSSVHASQHILQVFFQEDLTAETNNVDAHMEILHQKLSLLRQLKIKRDQYRLTITWWAPQRCYRPRHLNGQEAQELVTTSSLEILASLFGWPLSPQIIVVTQLTELIDIERQHGVNWGLESAAV